MAAKVILTSHILLARFVSKEIIAKMIIQSFSRVRNSVGSTEFDVLNKTMSFHQTHQTFIFKEALKMSSGVPRSENLIYPQNK